MKTPLADLSLDQPLPQHEMIYRHLRQLVLTGQLASGERLPSTQELAERWGANVLTVHTAFTRLAREGFVVRVNRVGTFVAQRVEKLTRVAIYVREDFSAPKSSRFARSITQQLQLLLREKGVHPDVWVDPRPSTQQYVPWPDLVRAAQQRRIQAVVAPQTHRRIIEWLAKLPIPWATMSTAELPNTVTMDLRQLVKVGLQALVKQGCRSVGFLFPTGATARLAGGLPNPYAVLFESFLDGCAELGLKFRNEWVLNGVPGEKPVALQRLGYELFHHLWRQRERPAGLLIVPDDLVESALTAMLELGVRVPGELKVAVHKNRHVDLFCPLPAMFILTDEAEYARALWAMVEKQFRGERCERVSLGVVNSP